MNPLLQNDPELTPKDELKSIKEIVEVISMNVRGINSRTSMFNYEFLSLKDKLSVMNEKLDLLAEKVTALTANA